MKRNDPRIEQYFNFELTPEEEAAFLEEAKENPEVWEHIQFMEWMVGGIQEEGKDELRTFIANRIAEEKEESSGKFWYAAAAVVVTLVVSTIIAWPYLQPSKMSEMAITANDQVAPDSTIAMNEEDNAETKKSEDSYSKADSAVALYAEPQMSSTDEMVASNNDVEYRDESAPADDNIAAESNLNAVPENDDKNAKPLPAQLSRVENEKRIGDVVTSQKSKSVAKAPSFASGLVNSKLKLDGQTITSYQVAVIEKHGTSTFLNAADSINYSNDPYRNHYPLKIQVILLRGVKAVPKNNRPSYQIIWNALTQQTDLYLQDFGDQSCLVYRLDSRNLYLEIQGVYYALNLKEGIQEPKKITDPAIIKALQN